MAEATQDKAPVETPIVSTGPILKRINSIRRRISYIKKDKQVGTGNMAYKAVTHDQVTALTRDLFIAAGVVIVPVLANNEFLRGDIVTKNGDQKREPGMMLTEWDIYFVNDDAGPAPDIADLPSTEVVRIRVAAHAQDSGDKAAGKACSYAAKNAILKLLMIETGEDDESRYQVGLNDDDVTFFVDSIRSSSSVEDLKERFINAGHAAKEAKDHSAIKTFTRVRDEVYTEKFSPSKSGKGDPK